MEEILNISSINHNLNSQYRIDVNTIPKNNILYQTSYISCTIYALSQNSLKSLAAGLSDAILLTVSSE